MTHSVLVVVAVVFAALVLAVSLTTRAQALTGQGAVINNGTVALGVTELGSLNYDCVSAADPVCLPASFEGTSVVGMRFLGLPADAGPGGLASTEPGCLCEGWGVADVGSGLTGFANEASGNLNVTSESLTSPSPDRAIATVNIADATKPGASMKVIQDYRPATGTPFLFINTVTVTNTGTVAFSDLLYRRVMDWDTEPTAFSEYSTIQGTSLQARFTSDDGFASSNPLAPKTYINSEVVCGAGYTGVCQFIDLGSGGTHPPAGPDDIGALFDFGFGALGPGESKVFSVVYGAAPSEAEAIDALTKVGTQIYSLGETSCQGETIPTCGTGTADAGPTLGKPVTFMFGFNTAAADLSLVKTASANRSQFGLDLTYTLAVKNNGPEESKGVVVTDPLPAGVKLVSATPTQGTCSGTTTVSCDLGSLANGATAEVKIVINPTPAAGKTLTNTATVSGLTGDGNQANNSSTVVTLLGKFKSNCRGITIDGLELVGTKNNDKLTGSSNSDQLLGNAGKDSLKGGKSADCLLGHSGNDIIKGDDDKDIIRAGSGNDKVDGGTGADNIRAQDGNDKVNGGTGDDSIKLQGQGVDSVNCGSGTDSVIGDSKDTISPNCEKVKIVGQK